MNLRAVFASCLSAILFLAAYTKFTSFWQFTLVLRDFKFIPNWMIAPIAQGVVIIELVVATSLLIPKVRRRALLCAAGLAALFLGYNVLRLALRLPGVCSCFPGILALSPASAALLDGGMIIAALVAARQIREQIPVNLRRIPGR